MRSWIAIIALLSTVLAAGTAAAEDVSVTVTANPEVVPIGGEVTLVVRIQGKFRKTSQPDLPPLDAFSVYQAGTSQSFSFTNGRRSSSVEFRYVLVAQAEGRYTIDPIRVTIGDRVYTGAPVVIEVARASGTLPAPRSDEGGEDDVAGEAGDRAIFVRATVDRDTVYVNQQVTWTFGFYTDGRLDLLRTPEYSPPEAEGFWAEDLPPQRSYYKNIRGRKFLVSEIKRGFFPTLPGKYTIGPARVGVVIEDLASRSVDDFFRRSFSSFGFGDTKSLSTEEIEITVLPLPRQGRPADFSGLVGRNLKLSVQADKQVVRAGDPVNVTVEVSGEGSFKTMAAPAIPKMREFKMYESGAKSDVFKNNYVVSGRKRSDFVLIPRAEGEQTIPAVRLSYFDPVAGAYRFVQSSPVRLQVQPGEPEQGGRHVIFAGSGEDIHVLGEDINYIHPVPATITRGVAPFYRNPVFLTLHALPLLALAVSATVEKRRRRWRNDVAMARASRAAKAAEKKLKNAVALEKTGDPTGAGAAVSAALREYIADKMNDSAPGLTEETVGRFLAGRGVPAGDIDRLLAILRACDGIQYAPVSAGEDRDAGMADDAIALVRSLERGGLA